MKQRASFCNKVECFKCNITNHDVMKYPTLLLISIIIVATLSTSNIYAIPAFSSQQIYDFSKTIVLGKVISVNSTHSSTNNVYKIKVEKFLKNPQDSDIIFAVGPNTFNTRLGNTVFNVDDRGLFFLTSDAVPSDSSSGVFVHPTSRLVDPQWDKCNAFAKEIPREHWVFGGTGPLPQARQGSNTDTNTFKKGIPVTISYDVSNLSNMTQEFTLSDTLTFGADHKFGGATPIILEPCTVYKTFEISFTPRVSGNYQFEIADPRHGTTGIGFEIKDSDGDTIESFDGKQFFVSPRYDAKIGVNDTINFHGIKFAYPTFPSPPPPGGSVSSIITFKDGATKRVGFLGPPPIPTLEEVSITKAGPTPVLAKHNNVFAGLLHDYDGIHLLVSVDSTDATLQATTSNDKVTVTGTSISWWGMNGPLIVSSVMAVAIVSITVTVILKLRSSPRH